MTKTRLHLSLVYFLLSSIALKTSAVTFICRDGDNLLKEDQQVSTAFRALTTLYELNKTAVTQEDPIDLTAIYDYTSLSNGRNFDKIKEICEVDLGFDLCTVKTNSKHSETLDSFPILRDVTEVSKPVCFPKSCSDSQVSIVDPNPANCDPSIMNCEVISYEVNCPARNVTNDTSTCASDVVPRTSPMNARLNVLEATVLSSCAALVAGGQNPTCSLKYGSFSVSTAIDLSKRDIEVFANYEKSCVEAGGRICNSDFAASYKIPNGNIGDLFLTESYSQFPMCVSTDCSDPIDKEDIATEMFREYTRVSLTAPICDEAVCNVTISGTTCPAGAPSAAPSVATPAPTISKEPTVTWSPTVLERIAKTKPPVEASSSSALKISFGGILCSFIFGIASLLF